jgi:hypothetical protein
MSDSTKETRGNRREVTIRTEIPQGADVSARELAAIESQTENEIVDSLTGDRAVAFIKFKAKEKTEIVIQKESVKEKVF